MQDALIPNLTVIPMFFIFIAFCWVMNHFFFKPTLDLIAERKKRTSGMERDARNLESQIQGKWDSYLSQMTIYRNQAKTIREEILRKAGEERASIIGSARERAEARLEQGRKEIISAADVASKTLVTQAHGIAKEIYTKLTGGKAA